MVNKDKATKGVGTYTLPVYKQLRIANKGKTFFWLSLRNRNATATCVLNCNVVVTPDEGIPTNYVPQKIFTKTSFAQFQLEKWVYFPGETVKGRFLFKTEVDMKYHSFVLSMEGGAKTLIVEGSGAGASYFWGTDTVMKDSKIVKTPEKKEWLKKGIYEFPFSYDIPRGSPGTFHVTSPTGGFTSSNYVITLNVNTGDLPTQGTWSLPFRVMGVVRPSMRLLPWDPLPISMQMKTFAFGRGEVSALGLVPERRLYYIGEHIPVVVRINNSKSKKDLSSVKISLIRKDTWKAVGGSGTLITTVQNTDIVRISIKQPIVARTIDTKLIYLPLTDDVIPSPSLATGVNLVEYFIRIRITASKATDFVVDSLPQIYIGTRDDHPFLRGLPLGHTAVPSSFKANDPGLVTPPVFAVPSSAAGSGALSEGEAAQSAESAHLPEVVPTTTPKAGEGSVPAEEEKAPPEEVVHSEIKAGSDAKPLAEKIAAASKMFSASSMQPAPAAPRTKPAAPEAQPYGNRTRSGLKVVDFDGLRPDEFLKVAARGFTTQYVISISESALATAQTVLGEPTVKLSVEPSSGTKTEDGAEEEDSFAALARSRAKNK